MLETALTILAMVPTTIILGMIGFIAFCYISSEKKQHCTVVPEGEIQFIVAGGKDPELKKILLNIEGYHLEGETIVKNTPGNDEDTGDYEQAVPVNPSFWRIWDQIQVLLFSKFGIRWVSWFYPLVHIHSFEVSKNKLVTDDEGVPITRRIRKNAGMVSSLRFRIIRPTLVANVELPGDQATIHILVYGTYEIVNPVTVAFLYKVQFAEQIDAAVRSVVNNFCQTYKTSDGEYLTLKSFTQMIKGEHSPLNICLDCMDGELDTSASMSDPIRDLVRDVVTVNISERYGVRVDEAYLQEWDATEDTQKIKNAIQEVEVATQNKLKADQDALADAARQKEPIESIKGLGVSPDLAAVVWQNVQMAQRSVDKAAALRPGAILMDGSTNVMPTLPLTPQGVPKGNTGNQNP